MFTSTYIKVILPKPLPVLYTYEVPNEWVNEIEVGKRVEVQFGKRRIYAALVHSFTSKPNEVARIKPILSVLDESPIVYKQQIKFWEWMSHYYMCTLGDVMNAALPAAFKLSSESSFLKNPMSEFDELSLSGDEFMIVEALEFQERLSLSEIQQIVSKKSVFKLIKGLLNKQIIYIEESLKTRYKPKVATFIELSDIFKADLAQKELLDDLNKATKQQAIVLAFLDQYYKGVHQVKKTDLLKKANASGASLKSLVDKGVFKLIELEIDRVQIVENQLEENVLNEEQRQALQKIQQLYNEKSTVLLHGITSSGKTHIYVELIKQVVNEGKQVLFLLPEIALTAQLIQRLRRWLGDVGIYHSKFNDSERIEIWNKVYDGTYKIVVGARSALLLPFESLGLIIADEEHDVSYKQFDPAPRYQARDSAIFLASLHQAKVLLGSATPSFESNYNALTKKYGKVEVKNRFGGVQPPEIFFADLKEARKRKQMMGALTPMLKDAMDEVLSEGNQVILFQNRRGYAPYLNCASCNWIPYCKNCDVSLTYHKFSEDLRCHYCGYRENVMHQCRQCKSPEMELRGMGTERIEDELKLLFPDAKVGRMDYDTVKNKAGHEKIIKRLENREIDILVGTQMVTKGLDFEKVKLVGVLNADALLYYPDFRSLERAYQMLKQVSGRAGRKQERGKVIIQISDVTHPIADLLVRDDGYEKLFTKDMLERQAYKYPPYLRLIKVTFKHKDYQIVEKGAQLFAKNLKTKWGSRIIGPIKPVISKIKLQYIREITIKVEKKSAILEELKQSIRNEMDNLYQYQEYRALRINIDVDSF